MDKYTKQLSNQFRLAKGISPIDYFPELYEKEYYEWLFYYNMMGKEYLKWLKDLGIITELSKDVAEIGKGEFDTVTLNENTTLITPYARGIKQRQTNNTIYDDDFTVFDGIPLFRSKDFYTVEGINTFMTQNPYYMMDIELWHQLYNYGDSNIIVGMYGNTSDLNRENKLKYLKRLREKIKDEFKIEETTNNDAYYYVLATKKKRSRR